MTKKRAQELIRKYGSNRENSLMSIKPTKWVLRLGRIIEKGLPK